MSVFIAQRQCQRVFHDGGAVHAVEHDQESLFAHRLCIAGADSRSHHLHEEIFCQRHRFIHVGHHPLHQKSVTCFGPILLVAQVPLIPFRYESPCHVVDMHPGYNDRQQRFHRSQPLAPTVVIGFHFLIGTDVYTPSLQSQPSGYPQCPDNVETAGQHVEALLAVIILHVPYRAEGVIAT